MLGTQSPVAVQDQASKDKLNSLQAHIAQLREEKGRLRHELHKKTQELSQAAIEMKRLQDSESTLRNIVLTQTSTQKEGDDVLIKAFTHLRQRVQVLVKSEYFDNFTVNRKVVDKGKDIHLMRFYDTLNSYSKRGDRQHWIRAKIFLLLWHNIFDFNCYGLYGVNLDLAVFRDMPQRDDRLAEFTLSGLEDELKTRGGNVKL